MSKNIMGPTTCKGGVFRAKNPDSALGHTNCSVHRPCTGNKYWEPDHCGVCFSQEAILKNMSGKERLSHLATIRDVLEEVVKKVKKDDAQRNWEFEPIFEYKFKKFMHFERFLNSPTNSPPSSPKRDDGDSDVIILDSEDEQEHEQELKQEEGTEQDQFMDDETNYNAYDDADYNNYEDETSIHSNNIVEDVCTALQCVKEYESAQCDDPVHFNISQHMGSPRKSRRDLFEQGVSSKRSRSPSRQSTSNVRS